MLQSMQTILQLLQAVMPSWPVLLMIWAIVLVGATVQSGMGMGFGLAVGPVLALLDPSFVPGTTLVIGMITALAAAVAERRAICWPEVGTATIGRLAGIALAMAVLSILPDRQTFLLAFGVTILFALLLSVTGWRMAFNRGSLIAMGAISGLMGTITSVGAPPLAIVYQDHDPAHARPTLSAFFFIGCLGSIAGLTLSGWFHWDDLTRAILLLPPMVVGIALGQRLTSRIDSRYRYLLWSISGLAAIQLIIRGLS